MPYDKRATTRTRQVRVVVCVMVAVLAASLLGGAVWGLLAPVEHVVVVDSAQGLGTVLSGESAHEFDAVALFVCVGLVTGLLTAIAAWRLRGFRGPLLAAGVIVASLLGSQVMSWFGGLVAGWRHPHHAHPPVHTVVALPASIDGWPDLLRYIGEHLVGRGTEAGTGAAVLIQPLFAALAVLVAAIVNTAPDLGTGLDHVGTGAFVYYPPPQPYQPQLRQPLPPAAGPVVDGAGQPPS
ncbi:DUF2567 domain-containing protein [Nocardia stercoris]|nr:DUF2567 domain-containing protein [Nocardia stercoris]